MSRNAASFVQIGLQHGNRLDRIESVIAELGAIATSITAQVRP